MILAFRKGIASAEQPFENPAVASKSEEEVWVAGRNGVHYPAYYNRLTQRLRILEPQTGEPREWDDDELGQPLQKAWDKLAWWPAATDRIVRGLCKGVVIYPNVLAKAAGTQKKPAEKKNKPSGSFFSRSEIEGMNLRWITVHPNGPGTEGQPILVHDNGSHYTVVGGAGGSMNQLVLKKDSKYYQEVKKQKGEAKEKQAQAAEQAKQEHPKEYERLLGIKVAAQQEATEHMSRMQEVTEKVTGQNMEELENKIREEATRAARELGAQIGSESGLSQSQFDKALAEADNLPPKQREARKQLLEKGQQSKQAFTEADIHEFGEQAVVQARAEAMNAHQQLMGQMIEQLADHLVHGGKTTGSTTVEIAGKKIKADYDVGDMMEMATHMASIATSRAKKNAVTRALNTGRYEIIGGLDQHFTETAPSPEEVADFVKRGALDRRSVKANARLVQESERASESRQRRSQSQGAADTLNGIVNDAVGRTVTNPEVAKLLGPEGVARVAAAVLREEGVDTKEKADQIGERIAQTNYASVVTALSTSAELKRLGMDAMRASSKKAIVKSGPEGALTTPASVHALAATIGLGEDDYRVSGTKKDGYQLQAIGDPAIQAVQAAGLDHNLDEGMVTFAQAGVVNRTMGAERLRKINIARGEMRAAAALAQHLKYDPKESLTIDAGDTVVEAHQVARELGLKVGEYRFGKRAGGGYEVMVDPENMTKLARSQTMVAAQRGVEKEELVESVRDRVKEGGASAYHHHSLQDGTEKDAAGNPIGAVALMPHQILAVESAKKFKRDILNMGPGSGKTAVYYTLMAEWMDQGVKGILTMPAKPRAQQADYTAEEWEPHSENGNGGWVKNRKTGEKRKFLKEEAGKKIVVIKSGAQLKSTLEKVKAGKVNFMVMSPELMRDHADLLVEHGFADPKGTAIMGDEAHEFAIGTGEKASEKSNALRRLATAEHVVLGSGTLISKNGSELHSLVDVIAPGALGSKKKFTEEWERLAQQNADGGGAFTKEKMTAMKQMLSPFMTSFHKPPERAGGQGELVREDSEVRTVKTPPEVSKQIQAINRDFEADMASGDEGKRREAALRRDNRVNRTLLSASLMETVKDEIVTALAEGTQAGGDKLPSKVMVWGQETGPNSPARKLKAALGEEMMSRFKSVTGAEGDKQVQEAVRMVNDMSSDIVGAMVSNAANYGINFQGVSHVMMLGLPATETRQIIARALRHGQKRDVVKAVHFITDHIFHQLQAKRVLGERAASVDLLAELQDEPIETTRKAVVEGVEEVERRTPEMRKHLEKTLSALLSDETGMGEMIARHWGTIVEAARGKTGVSESGGGERERGWADGGDEQFERSVRRAAVRPHRAHPAGAR